MKYFKILAILLCSSVISFYACNEKTTTDSQKKVEPQPYNVSNSSNQTNTANPNTTTPEPAQNAVGVWHYTCSKGCAGGAGSAGNCATCGNRLAHNQAYHSSTATNNSTPTTVESGKNAAGIWHYTCGNGCAGGSGSAGNCTTCGSALAHNQAYHQ